MDAVYDEAGRSIESGQAGVKFWWIRSRYGNLHTVTGIGPSTSDPANWADEQWCMIICVVTKMRPCSSSRGMPVLERNAYDHIKEIEGQSSCLLMIRAQPSVWR